MARVFFEHDPSGAHGGKVAGEIICVQEKANPPASLVADRSALRRAVSFGQQDRGFSARRRDPDPAFAWLARGVFQ